MVPGLRGRVLTALVRSPRPLSLRELARRAGSSSPGSVKRVLTSLMEEGLVRYGLVSKGSTFFEVNHEHLLVKHLVDIDHGKDTVIDEVRAHVATWPRDPRAVVLFGSVARGEDTSASDVDVLVVWQSEQAPSDDWDADTLKLIETIYNQTGNSLNLLVFTASEWEAAVERREPVVGDVARDGVCLVGSAVRTLVNATSTSAAR
ncbi:MAG: nucleotidyltransferase domain-containing protein [Actinomycetales bacterium]|nr:nucleotidyltransferase domain-containing protein [Actinomycetales bacterium]